MKPNRLSKLVHAQGGPADVARRLSVNGRKVTPERVTMWLVRGQPSEAWTEPLAALLGVAPASLRPDLYRRKRA